MAKLYFYYASINAGKPFIDCSQTEVEGDDRYFAMCRKHFVTARAGR